MGFKAGVRSVSPVWVSTKAALPEPGQVVLLRGPGWVGTVGLGEYRVDDYPERPWIDESDVDMCGDPNHLRTDEGVPLDALAR